jgi:hypothetical protein
MTDYFDPTYDDKSRWVSYWYQIREILNFNPRKVLVIGKGNGLVSDYLKLCGVEATTLDIDESLKPDVVSSVLNMPFSDNFFDVVLCAQVLEHLPYNDFPKALSEIKRVIKLGAVISLPHFGPAIKFLLKIPLLPEIKFLLKIPYPKKHLFKKEHFWEIGEWGFPAGRIKREFKKAGFSIAKDFVVFEKPLHHFFVLKK